MAKTILITGCSTGIGRFCALELKKAGWRVFATARTEADLASLEAEGLESLYLDYTDQASIDACADHVLAATDGNIDALFNNGAYGQPGAVEDLETDILRAQFEANFFGWHHLTCRLIPAMRKKGSGRIIQNSSVLGLVALKYRGAYNATKFALEGLSDTMRLELRGSGVHLSLIEPGPITSAFVENALRKFQDNIDIENSAHHAIYKSRMSNMNRGGTTRFKLGPEAVHKKLLHALESPRPKPHYYVTFPTYFMAAMRRLLPARAFDNLCDRVSD
ncbi:SDR family oxidoreductase [Coralliovum pocilloporae]|uniref:SDR family oxidoreductase n=1 Tax=Coralliovum pocilloporae TaxID=3066369 RepID=UPI003306CC35